MRYLGVSRAWTQEGGVGDEEDRGDMGSFLDHVSVKLGCPAGGWEVVSDVSTGARV